MKNIFLIFFIILPFSFAVSSDQDAEMRKQLEEVMKARDAILRSLMDDSSFQDMSARMEKLMQNFDRDDFFNGENLVAGEYDWIESKTHKILSLKVKQMKDQPLDIKINKGQITIKGNVESQSREGGKKKVSRVHFERVFSIPGGVDGDNPEFENKADALLIKFKKKIASSPIVPSNPKKELTPVGPNPQDETI
jgi:HSP20 family molecular chaperone IbpA